MKPSMFTTLSIIVSGLALCLVSLYMLHTTGTAAESPTLSLPVASYQPGEFGKDRQVQISSSTPVTEAEDEVPGTVDNTQGANESSIVRVRIPRVGIDAPIETKTVDGTGAMQNPHGPESVAWYDFSAKPGNVGNIVMAGHVDYYNDGPAVFWHLKDLKAGDRVEIAVASGETFIYEVASLNYYTAATAPVSDIIGPTLDETLTMITCGGSFDSSQLEYDERLVVKATRVAETAP